MQIEHSFLIQIAKVLGCQEIPVSNWNISHSHEWIEVSNIEAQLPSQGWKLHISSTVKNATQILEKLLPVLLKEQVCFKVASTPSRLTAMNRGDMEFSQVGKFITVYPIDDLQAVRLATMLSDVTTLFQGPRVPSDRPLRTNGVVYYRYGAFQPCWLQTSLGTILPALENADGTMVPDFRGIVFRLPPWVQDPFEAAGVVDHGNGEHLLVHERYLIGDVIANTSETTINLSVDTTNAEIRILKRLKPGFEDMVLNRMRHEAAILKKFNGVTVFPDLHDFIDNDNEHCLVMDYVSGLDLEKQIAEFAAFGSYMPFSKIIKCLSSVATALLCMHKRGFCYGDLKPPHVFILPNGEVKLVDLESISLCGEISKDLVLVVGTPGYASPQRLEGKPLTVADDIFSFGALLYFLATNADPSNAPDRQRLLNRPVTLMNPGVPTNLVTLIHRCLDPNPEYRPSSMDEVIVMLTAPDPVKSIFDLNLKKKTTIVPLDLSKKLALKLCKLAHPRDRDGLIWSFDVRGNDHVYHRDIEMGNAGIVLALATLTSEINDPEFRYVLSQSALSLANSKPFHGGPHPGLYIGEAGIGAALLSAGVILKDDKLIDAAIEKGRLVHSLPHNSPDLFNGTAGRLRFHLFLWEVTHDDEHLQAAISCGDFILAAADEINKHEVQWKLPQGYGIGDEQAYLGYAHGTAGIADALIDLYEVTPTDQILKIIRASVTRLSNTAIKVLDDNGGLDWPSEDSGEPGGGFWCHGAAGIARFLLRASSCHISPQARKIAHHAAKTTAVGIRWAGPSQCHGLAGNAEVLLDFFQSTGKQEYLDSALALTELSTTFLEESDNLEPSSPGALLAPGLMKGLAGLMVCLLRVSAPKRLPHILSVAAFQRLSKASNLKVLGF